ncbi:ankyrin repeat-containing domain protein [Ilyonectria destructans]|nr:ankyrin repeat-containing domain protein [Ilyonectria destructans]
MSDSENYSEPDAVIIDRDDVSNYNPDNILPKSIDEIEKLREWLEPTSYAIAGGEFRKHLASHAPGTGQWLTSTDEYQQWLQGEECGLLWIKGIPGSGKSVHVAKLIDDLGKSNPGCPVLFFFFRQIITANHNPQALLRDWMDQVLQYSPPLQHRLSTYIKDGVSLSSLSTGDLLKDLQMAFRGLPNKVFCIADALDEMDTGNDAFLQAIGSLGQQRPAKVKVLITSRPVPSVEIPLHRTTALHIRLEERFVDIDISKYVHSALSGSHIPQSNWSVIANTVPGRANGLFLYAKLAMEAFLEVGADIEAILLHLPADLNVLYTDLLQEHARRSGISPSIQHLILQSVTHATKPLRLLELAEMCRVIDPTGSGRDLREMKDLIRTACGPLLEILPDETVSVVHHSFTEYLKGTTRSQHEGGYPVLQPGLSHAQLAISCLRYLLVTHCLDEVDISIDDSDEQEAFEDDSYTYPVSQWVPPDIVELRMKFPFFVYATRNWHVHIRSSEATSHAQDEINEVLEKFLGVDKTVKAWLQVTWRGNASNARKVSALHVAGRHGLIAYTRKLVAGCYGGDVDPCDIAGKTPLWWAASNGHAATVSELIIAGADPGHSDGINGWKPLHEAARKNHYAVVKVLLEAGVHPLTSVGLTNQQKARGSENHGSRKPALTHACGHGHVEAVDAFLPFLDLETMHRCLAWAAQSGQARVVMHMLSQPGVQVDARVRGSTALFKACSSRDLATVEALLGGGAHPELLNEVWGDEFESFPPSEAKESDGSHAQFTCLHALCGIPGLPRIYYDWDDGDCYEIATLLVNAGADVHRQMEDGTTALHHIAEISYSVARLLIEAGASADAVDSEGKTPLYYSETLACVSLLIEQGGADVNAQDLYGNTPLLAALARYNNETKVLLLLECGADAKVRNWAGDSTLHIALQSNFAKPNIVQALLASGVEPDVRNRQHQTPLMCSFRSLDAENVCDVLLAAGADINARDRAGHSIFWHQTSQMPELKCGDDSKPHADLLFLLDHGALPRLRDVRGRTCLHEAIKKQPIGFQDWTDTPRFDFLLGIGLDHTIVDHEGNSILHVLAAREESGKAHGRKWVLPLWERLVCTLGLDVDHQNHFGRTPLHILCDAYPRNAERFVDAPEPIDFLIARMKKVDAPDHAGMTALHVASTRTEYCTKKLLEAGLNSRATTHKGLTPLHLATHAEESNIVGMLVRWLRKSSPRTLLADPETLLPNDVGDRRQIDGIDTKDGNGFSALYYAVRSGRPETVTILLEAGAKVNADENMFRACSGFEAENAFRNATCQVSHDPLTHREATAEASTRHATSSPVGPLRTDLSPSETRRLEEIVSLLVSFGADSSGLGPTKQRFDHGIIDDCIWHGNAYTARCLFDRVPQSLWVESGKSTHYSNVLEASAPAYDPLLASSKKFLRVVVGEPSYYNFLLFMRQRQYQLVRELAERGTRFLPDPRDEYPFSHFTILVKHGCSLLVKMIGVIVAERALGQGDWHAFGDSSKAGLWCANRPVGEAQSEGKVVYCSKSDVQTIPKPFLLEAVQRDLPNLSVVKSLVEDFHVDVNERIWSVDYIENERQLAYDDSALHYVAQGLHWWHVHQALEYFLIAPGIDINLRIKRGLTPLHVAIGGSIPLRNPRPYSYDSVKRLLKAGADIHAVTNKGESCLSIAKHDVQITRLLIDHGAIISPDDVVSAVEVGQTDVLHELLQARDDDGEGPDLDLDPALYAAGMLFIKSDPDDMTWRSSVDNMTIIKMIEILIDHGANPLSGYFYGKLRDDSSSSIHFGKDASSHDANAECRTLLHSLILGVEDFQIQPFLVPGLDVNHRNPQGLTVLHAACTVVDLIDKKDGPHDSAVDGGQEDSILKRLVALGADVAARDNLGRTSLMYLLGSCSQPTSPRWRATMGEMIHLVPELVHDADLEGNTALMYAVHRAVGPESDTETVQRLLSAGASPLVTNKRGESVLHVLAGDLGTARLRELLRDLVNRGADINGQNAIGETPLFVFAHRYPQYSNSEYYRDDAKRNARGHEYEDPREQGAIALLQDLGADFFVKDKKGRGLLHVAATGDVVRFQELMAVGLDPMMENDIQQTAIDIAAACGNNDVLEIFEKMVRK